MLIFANACQTDRRDQPSAPSSAGHAEGNSYAGNFILSDDSATRVLTVLHPWQGSEGKSYRYLLCDTAQDSPPSIPEKDITVVKLPVKKVVITSTTHIPYISELGHINSILGVSGQNYICDSVLSERIRNGQVRDIGYDQSLNYELIISLRPDVVFAYGVTGEISNHISRLAKLGIPVVIISEYLEGHPLGKAEWIRVFAAFFGEEKLGDSLFLATSTTYEAMAEIAAAVKHKPGVLSGLPWNDIWYVPGGQSFAARLIYDAGGNYLWKDNGSFEAIPLDIEAVYKTAREAEFWINPGAALSKQEILSLDSRLGELKAFRTDHVYNNNARLNVYGGNDYWESGVMHPDIILKDLIQIFHPDVLPGRVMIYYRKL
jgi:iron complex transport system substrate-binding protein